MSRSQTALALLDEDRQSEAAEAGELQRRRFESVEEYLKTELDPLETRIRNAMRTFNKRLS